MSKKIMLAQMPKGFFPIYFIQLFSTMSFAVLYSTLVLYMKEKLGLSSQEADIITGVYFAYNFALHLLAGFIGGRFFSYRSLIAIGSVFQLIGCLFLAEDTMRSLYMGLAMMLVGTGTMVTCINMLLSQLFEAKDMRREYAFFWNYSGMNIGFVLGFSIAGYFQLNNDYHMLFTLTALTNVVSLGVLGSYWKHLRDRNTVLSKFSHVKKAQQYGIGFFILLLLVPAIYVLLHHTQLSDNIVIAAGIIMILLLGFLAFQYEPVARKKIFAFIIILLFGQIFWIIYQLAPMVFTLFARFNVDRHVFGITIAPAWIQNINSLTIIVGGPLLAILFKWLRSKNRTVSIPLQYSVGIFLAGIGLLVLPIGIHYANQLGLMAFGWLFITYVLQALAELCLGPIGYSMVGLLAPARLQSIMMGMVLLNCGVAAVLASYFSNYAIGKESTMNPLITNPNFSHSFMQLGIVTIIAAIVLFSLAAMITKKFIQAK